MKIKFLVKLLGSGFYTGYLPVITGTFGSLAGLIIYFIPGFEKIWIMLPVTLFVFIIGLHAGNVFEQVYGKDPAQCTIDEIAGMWISLMFLPKSIIISGAAFLVWRIMDIVKPFPARRLESLPGGLGIMIDDVVAGIYACILMNIAIHIF